MVLGTKGRKAPSRLGCVVCPTNPNPGPPQALPDLTLFLCVDRSAFPATSLRCSPMQQHCTRYTACPLRQSTQPQPMPSAAEQPTELPTGAFTIATIEIRLSAN